MHARPPSPLSTLLLCLALALPWLATASLAQLESEAGFSCEPPISTCGPSPFLSTARPEIWPPDDCPVGYACTCVPSCPTCKDCDARVCVRDPSRECRTACDCPTGLGCLQGQCIPDFAPVYCCDSEKCPAGAQCQDGEGSLALCPEPDPSCIDRQVKAKGAVDHVVERANRCKVDSDCAYVGTDTECVGTCGAWVNEDRVDHVRKWISWIDRRICTGYVADGCPRPTPDCLVTRGASCIDNRCVELTLEPGPPPVPLDPLQSSAPDGGMEHLAPRR